MKKYICKLCLNWFFSDVITEYELVTCPCCSTHMMTKRNAQGIINVEWFDFGQKRNTSQAEQTVA